MLASLNHPNIGSIHGLEESNGVNALVLELVEGPTLADRIARGPIPLDEALPIARQIAEALEAAHEQGIIHRDLKPANIKLRPDGSPFGVFSRLTSAISGGAQSARRPLHRIVGRHWTGSSLVLISHDTRSDAIVSTCNLLSVMFPQERIKIVDLLVRECNIAHPAPCGSPHVPRQRWRCAAAGEIAPLYRPLRW